MGRVKQVSYLVKEALSMDANHPMHDTILNTEESCMNHTKAQELIKQLKEIKLVLAFILVELLLYPLIEAALFQDVRL